MRTTARGRSGVVQRERKDPRVQTIGGSVLTRHKTTVGHEMEMVTIQLGSDTLRLPYDDAFRLSMLIRVHAKQAKKFAGDGSKHWSTFGVLTDAEENYRRNF